MVSFRDSNANTRPKELVIYINLPKLVSRNHLFRPLFASVHYHKALHIIKRHPKQGLHSPSNNAAIMVTA